MNAHPGTIYGILEEEFRHRWKSGGGEKPDLRAGARLPGGPARRPVRFSGALTMTRRFAKPFPICLLFLLWLLPAAAQVAPAPNPLEPAAAGGLPAVDRALAKLSANQRLLVIGAHPDDEDTSLIGF